MQPKKSRKIIVLVPKRKKFAYFIRTVKLVNRFFGIESYKDMAIYYGTLILMVIAGLIAIDAMIRMLFV